MGAGGLYGALCQRLGAVHLEENHRQREVAERQALARLRAGDAEAYLAHAAREGRLRIADDAAQAKQQLLRDWWAAASEGSVRDCVMLAHRRADVADLNEAARALLRREGRLGDAELVAGQRGFRAGDRVICRRNDSGLGVCNGTRATVRRVEPLLGLITLQLDGGPIRQLPTGYAAEHLEHGYALTGHGAQGATVDRAFVLVRTQGALAEWGYVAVSRSRLETRLYAVGPEIDAGAHRGHETAVTRSLADALSRSGAERAALDQATVPRRPRPPVEVERLRVELDSGTVRLRAAERELSRLGYFGRGPRHAELREAIATQRRALHELRAELRALVPDDVRVRPAPAERARSWAFERPVRQAPARGMGLGL